MKESSSMYERLQKVFALYSRTLGDNQLAQNDYLLKAYWNSLNDYLLAFQILQATPFHFPFDFFYLENEKLYSSIAFYYHGHPTRKRALNYGLSDYLATCGLPGGDSPEMNALIDCLVRLLKLFKFSRSESALAKLRRFSPELSAFLRSTQMEIVAGSLVYLPHQDYRKFGQLYSYSPATSLPVPPNIPRQLLKQFFSAKLNELSDSTQNFPVSSLVFNQFHEFWNFAYQPNISKCVAEPVKPASICSVKAIEWTDPPSLVPAQTESLLAACTGYNLAMLKELAVLFPRILTPSSFGSTVLYTHSNADTLRSFFRKVFEPWLISFPDGSNAPKQFISVNRLTKSRSMRSLFEARVAGKGLVLLRDIPASSSSKQILSKLRKGTPIPVRHPFVPKQYLYGNAHLLCITDDRNRAHELRKQLKANWIDLSAVERSVMEVNSLSSDSLHWLRCVFPLLGLQLLSTNASFFAPPASDPTPFDAVDDFMAEGVIKGPGAFCTSFELYDAYQSYYKARFSANPPLSKIVFTKRARAYVAAHAPHMNYRHARLGKKKKLRWYFTGLEPNPWAEANSPSPSGKQKTAFREYLDSGYFLMPQFPFGNQSLHPTIVKRELPPS